MKSAHILFVLCFLINPARGLTLCQWQPQQFGLGVYDAESHLLYLNHRYLNTRQVVSFFIEPDSLDDEQKAVLFNDTYHYADGNPINRIDISGLSGLGTSDMTNVLQNESGLTVKTWVEQILASLNQTPFKDMDEFKEAISKLKNDSLNLQVETKGKNLLLTHTQFGFSAKISPDQQKMGISYYPKPNAKILGFVEYKIPKVAPKVADENKENTQPKPTRSASLSRINSSGKPNPLQRKGSFDGRGKVFPGRSSRATTMQKADDNDDD